ncbi:putative transcriptional regulatory protein [Lachnellula hyalina]|uniref:Putative transcriptional regulatory protein n=1 Tax=Lachnellula hyalina TaxID=1316788 RepID=A0A8H8R2E2_9HELO|nr:putative transcriptional regulatory protein [Lachnellula hyalina]TVY25639.1 putative transcriptional regulatory protein [Lachnellula hyalina]
MSLEREVPRKTRDGLRRRVPSDLRKRAAFSCDFCKARRRKCVRLSAQGHCELCRENHINCILTVPRKSRSYNSTENLHPRYRVMETLISRLFPHVAVEDTTELIKLSQYVECYDVKIDCENTRQSANSRPRGFPFAPPPSPSPPDSQSWSEQELHQPLASEIFSPPATSISCHEHMLQNSSGTLSYFGSSSSMAFVAKLRELLAHKGSRHSESLQGKERKLCDEFIADKYSRTMERESRSANDNDESPVVTADLRAPGRPRPEIDGMGVDSSKEPLSSLAGLLDQLPSKEETEEFVERFFIHVHPNILLFHRPTFQAILEELWSNSGRECDDIGWIVCFCVIVIFGCESRLSSANDKSSLEWQDICKLQRKLLNFSLSKVSELMLSATLQSVQAFTLLSIYLNCANERNASWILSGCAIRMAISLGLHRGESVILLADVHMASIDRELRKRVWWSLYIFEQYNSALFGRPSAIDDTDMVDDFPAESLLDEGFHRPPHLLRHDVALARIVGKIRKSQIYQGHDPAHEFCRLPDLVTVDGLLKELDVWHESLPLFLQFDETRQEHIYPNHFRQIVTLQLRYQHARLLLSRPFHLKALYLLQSSQHNPAAMDSTTKYSDVCVNAAFESWKLTRVLWKKNEFDGNLWLDGIFTYQFGLVLSLTFLDPRERPVIKDLEELQHMIQDMLDILHEARLNKTMRRLVQIFEDFAGIVRAIKCRQDRPVRGRDSERLQETFHQSNGHDIAVCSEKPVATCLVPESSALDSVGLETSLEGDFWFGENPLDEFGFGASLVGMDLDGADFSNSLSDIFTA